MKLCQYNPNRGPHTSTALDGNVFALFVLESKTAQNLHNKAYCPTDVSAFHVSVIAGVAPLCAFHYIVVVSKWLSVPLNTIICLFRHKHPSHHINNAATTATATITTTAHYYYYWLIVHFRSHNGIKHAHRKQGQSKKWVTVLWIPRLKFKSATQCAHCTAANL
jgi:hypothetical protein